MKIKILTITAVLALFTIAFLAGRSFENQKTQADIFEAFEDSSDTDYIIVSADQYNGEWAQGRCFTPNGEKLILKYYPEL